MTNLKTNGWRGFILGAILLLGSVIPGIAASEIPFTIEGGQIIIRVKVKKDVPVEAVVLTGSPYSYMHPDLLLRLKLQMKYTNDGPVTGRNDRILLFTELQDVIVADEKPTSLYIKNGSGGMVGTSLSTLSKKMGREIGLSLGADFFRNKIVQIDFKQKVIRFLDAAPVDYKTSLSADAGSISSIHRMATTVDTFYGGHVSLPAVTDITFDGTKLTTLLDTGSAYPVLLSTSSAKTLSFSTPEKGQSNTIQLKSLKIGVREFNDVPGLVLGKDIGPFETEVDHVAVIGLGVLQNLLLTFDWRKGMIVVHK